MFRKAIYALFLVVPCAVQAAAVLDYEDNDRQWGSSNTTNMLTVVTNAGHTVTSGVVGTLAGFDVLLLGEPLVALTAGEIATAKSFVEGGGTLLVFTDSGCNGCTEANDVLSGIGSSISLSTTNTASVDNPLPSVYFTDAPRDIAGDSVSLTPGRRVDGGTALIGDYGAYETVGSGLVVAFGDRIDFDGPNPVNGTSINSQLILNILDNSGEIVLEDTVSVPGLVSWSMALMIFMLFGLGVLTIRVRLRRTQ